MQEGAPSALFLQKRNETLLCACLCMYVCASHRQCCSGLTTGVNNVCAQPVPPPQKLRLLPGTTVAERRLSSLQKTPGHGSLCRLIYGTTRNACPSHTCTADGSGSGHLICFCCWCQFWKCFEDIQGTRRWKGRTGVCLMQGKCLKPV